MIYSRKIKWKLLLSITGNEYQKNLFRTGIKASPGIEQRKTEKKKRNELLNPPNVLTTTAKAAYINCEIFSQKATKLVSIERRNDL